ncbi:ankyrin repeat domain-containing protein [Glycomyces sp. NPDC048151]|uniref:ankyrin repeat domain-containing protein n=1 Tax=Glycomyces sp. NPDC048151 TaxID=3364002 RepID=UPI00371B6AC3
MQPRKGIGRRAVIAAGLGALAACTPVPDAPRAPRTRTPGPARTPAPTGRQAERWGGELLDAARSGDAREAARLSELGADIEVQDGEGRSPLMVAVLEDHVAVAAVLVERGADPDARDGLGDTPWVNCGVTGSVGMMRALLPAGPDLEIPNRRGGSPLHPASERGHADYVREVLAATDIETVIDRVNYNGWTALLEAVALGDGGGPHQEIVAHLLDAGADRSSRDRHGRTALEVARRFGYTEIAALLEASA